MSPKVKSSDEYLDELTELLERFRHLVEIENAAIEKRQTSTLNRLMPDKMATSDALEALWREFQPRLANAEAKDREAFIALADRANQLRPLVTHNMTLLNAAKITTSNRIEAGVSAWRRSQWEAQTSYHDDGRVLPGERGGSIHPARLV